MKILSILILAVIIASLFLAFYYPTYRHNYSLSNNFINVSFLNNSAIVAHSVTSNNINLTVDFTVINYTYYIFITITNLGNTPVIYTFPKPGLAVSGGEINFLWCRNLLVSLFIWCNGTPLQLIPSYIFCPLIGGKNTVIIPPGKSVIYYYIFGGSYAGIDYVKPFSPGDYKIQVNDVFNQSVTFYLVFHKYFGDGIFVINNITYIVLPVLPGAIKIGSQIFTLYQKNTIFNGIILINGSPLITNEYVNVKNYDLQILVNKTWITLNVILYNPAGTQSLPYTAVFVNNGSI